MDKASPIPRLGPQALELAANAAGYSQACFVETSGETRVAARSSWLSMLPPPASFFLAALFLVL